VTGLAPTVDDVRLYLAFQNCGKVVEAHVAKPGEKRSEFPLAARSVGLEGNGMAAICENFRCCDPCKKSFLLPTLFPTHTSRNAVVLRLTYARIATRRPWVCAV
jgi:hypothetical protein